ncbi:MAG: BACON domain-containing protein, partial [Acidobacteria bacterium]|nr:BACON domain-containing protein [Acidobacteriota bacterium]
QTVVNPRTVEFDPSADHASLVTRYDLAIYNVGANSPFQIVDLGKPALDTDGKVRVDFASRFTAWPLPNGTYEARVSAVGPTGVGLSDLSNQFAFATTCSYGASPTAASMSAAGGSSTVSITTTAGCGWTATSGAAWLTLTPASGSGSGTVTFTVAANTATTARAATATIAGRPLTISQAGVAAPGAPQQVRVIIQGGQE